MQKMAPCQPAKPTLTIDRNEGGGICVNQLDTEKLMIYIYELESCL